MTAHYRVARLSEAMKVLPDGSWFEGQFHDSELEGTGCDCRECR